MRRYPLLTEQNISRDFIETFGGYNHHLRIGENEFYDMKNLSSDNYPILSTRKKRGKINLDVPQAQGLKLVGFFTHQQSICPIYLNETTYELYSMVAGHLTLIGTTKYDGSYERQSVCVGTKIVIFPDKLYMDTMATQSGTDLWKSLESVWKSPFVNSSNFQHACDIRICDEEGREVTVFEYFDTSTKPASDFLSEKTVADENGRMEAESVKGPLDKTYYCDIHTGTFYYWHPNSSSWLTQEMFIKIYENRTNFADYFNVGDAVKISGLTEHPYEMDKSTEALDEVFDNNLDDSFIIMKILDNSAPNTEIVLKHHPVRPESVSYQVYCELTIEKRVPEMDFVFENNNRLWGCRYGYNRDGEFVNEIYASALGDFTNWECFAGTSQDSWTLSVGAEGVFTGAISYLGNPVFFKENLIYTVLGSYPATYQLQLTECKGVQKKCGKSLVMIDGALFYKSVGGVSAYTGALPTEIGTPLNEQTREYEAATAGACDGKYYLSVKGKDNTGTLFVYDTTKGLWYKEDDLSVDSFYALPMNNSLYFKSGDVLYITDAGKYSNEISFNVGTTKEDAIEWYAETGVIGCSAIDKKYVSRMSLRLSVGIGTRVYVFAEYDSSGVWELMATITGTRLGTFTFPIKPKRCDHFRLRISGTDECKIYSISKTLEQGSDM